MIGQVATETSCALVVSVAKSFSDLWAPSRQKVDPRFGKRWTESAAIDYLWDRRAKSLSRYKHTHAYQMLQTKMKNVFKFT